MSKLGSRVARCIGTGRCGVLANRKTFILFLARTIAVFMVHVKLSTILAQ